MAAAVSSSTAGSTRGARSAMAICAHRPRMPSAHFTPVRPAPRMSTRLSGRSASARAEASDSVWKQKVRSTVSSPGMGGTNGRLPVAASSLS